jgi:hypothetical protein
MFSLHAYWYIGYFAINTAMTVIAATLVEHAVGLWKKDGAMSGKLLELLLKAPYMLLFRFGAYWLGFFIGRLRRSTGIDISTGAQKRMMPILKWVVGFILVLLFLPIFLGTTVQEMYYKLKK